jgi:hypothetical protein
VREVGHVKIDYTNYRNERAVREIIPSFIYWGSTTFHPEKQWLLLAFDISKDTARTFAMKDVHSWEALS